MTYAALYEDLDRGELRGVAARARLPLADVEQEARLICWEIASGVSRYRSELGTVRAFVMGRLWGWATRERLNPCAMQCGGDEEADAAEDANGVSDARWGEGVWVPSVLDVLVEQEGRTFAQSEADATPMPSANATWSERLAVLGVEATRIGALGGLTRQSIEKRRRRGPRLP